MVKYSDGNLTTEEILGDSKKVEAALTMARGRFLKGKGFDVRKKANAITAYCFRNTVLENYHSEGFISDSEMKNTSIETSARVEYLMVEDRFDLMKPKDIFEFTLKMAYKNNVVKDLTKPMWTALKREADRHIATIQYMKANNPPLYELSLLGTWSSYAHYYNESIKFDGERLTGDPNKIAVGH